MGKLGNFRTIREALEHCCEYMWQNGWGKPHQCNPGIRYKVRNALDNYLRHKEIMSAVDKYKVVCDNSNNPPSNCDTHRLNVLVYVRSGSYQLMLGMLGTLKGVEVDFTINDWATQRGVYTGPPSIQSKDGALVLVEDRFERALREAADMYENEQYRSNRKVFPEALDVIRSKREAGYWEAVCAHPSSKAICDTCVEEQ